MTSFKVKFALISTIVLWASAFVGIKIGLLGYSPGALALLRFLVASLSMAFVYSIQRIKISVCWKDRVQLLLIGMAGIGVYNICLNYGELTVSAGIASFIIGLMPVFTLLLSLVFLGERFNLGVCTGILISLIGLLLLAMGEGSDVGMRQGVLLILISAFLGSVLTMMQKHFARHYHPVAIISWVMWGGTSLLLIFTPDLIRDIQVADFQSSFAAIYMGIFPAAFAYWGWGYVLKHIPASQASIYLYAMPIISTLMGFICLGEMPTIISLMGGMIALMGALVAHRFLEGPSAGSDCDDRVMAV